MTSPPNFYHVIPIIFQMWSCDQSLVTVTFLSKKLSWLQFYKDLTKKAAFFEWLSWFRFNNLGLTLGMNLKFYTRVAKGSKLKVRKYLWLIRACILVCVDSVDNLSNKPQTNKSIMVFPRKWQLLLLV